MERRTLLALLLSFAVVMVWNQFFMPPPTESGTPSPPPAMAAKAAEGLSPSQVVSAPLQDSLPADVSVEASASAIPPKRFTFSSDEATVVFTNVGGGPDTVTLNSYRERFDTGGLLTWLWAGIQAGFKFPPLTPEEEPEIVRLLDGDDGDSAIRFALSPDGVRDLVTDRVVSESGRRATFESQQGPILIRKTYAMGDDPYSLSLEIEVRNQGNVSWSGRPTLALTERVVETVGPFDVLNRIVFVDDSADFEDASGIEQEGDRVAGNVGWFGVGDNYFLSAILLESPEVGSVRSTRVADDLVELAYTPEAGLTLGPAQSQTYRYTVFLGPKDIDLLGTYERELDKAINFGFLSVFAFPLLYLLRFFYGIVGSYGLAIIALTVTIKGLTFPLTQKSMRSMQRMKEIQPEIKKLQDTYAENKEQLNQEMMRLMSEKKVNPLGGCLPTVIQLPIWFSLYRVLQNSIELYRTPFLYLQDLSAADPYGISPVLVAVLMFVQQQLTPSTSMDPTQKRILQLMPLFFSFIMFNLPSGLVVYILVNSLLSITHHGVFNRVYAAKEA